MRAEIPKDWVWAPLGKLATDLLSGGTPSTKRDDYWSGTIPWITSKWLGEPLRLSSGEKYITPAALDDSASNIVPAGSLIYATRVGVGKVVVNEIDVAINQDLTGIVVDQRKAVPEFLAYQLRTNRVKSFINGNKRGTTIQGITKACAREIEVALPPIEEQRQIAAVLSAVQRAIERQERLIALTAELKKALMHKLFTEGTRGEPLKQTEIGPVPESWDLMELKSCCTVQSGYAFKSNDYVARSEGVPIIKIGDIQDGEVLISDKTSYVPQEFWPVSRLAQFRLTRGALLIALTGATTGKTGQFDSDERAFLNQRVGRFLPDKQRLIPMFLRFLVPQPYFQRNIKANILVAAQGNISPKSIQKFVVALPKPEEQVIVANALLCVDRRIATARALHHRLGELFRTLLHNLMTAEIRVHDLDLSALEEAAEPAGAV
jgi:type I restriction enzyme, S subunit